LNFGNFNFPLAKVANGKLKFPKFIKVGSAN
jgi:hypothetical protein